MEKIIGTIIMVIGAGLTFGAAPIIGKASEGGGDKKVLNLKAVGLIVIAAGLIVATGALFKL